VKSPSRSLAVILIFLTLLSAQLTSAQCKFCSDGQYEVNLSSTNPTGGDKVRGPVTIDVTGLNTLRYDYKFNSTTTYTAGPSVDLTKLAPVAAAAGAGAAAENKADSKFREELILFCDPTSDMACLEHEVKKAAALANAATENVNAASDDLKQLLKNSDSLLAMGMLQTEVAKRATAACDADAPVFRQGVCAANDWPKPNDLDVYSKSLKEFQTKSNADKALAQRKIDETLEAASKNGAAKDAIAKFSTDISNARKRLVEANTNIARLDKIAATLQDLDRSGAKYKAFAKAVDTLSFWDVRMNGISAADDPFAMEHFSNCSFRFGSTKKTDEKLVKTDLMPGSGDGTAAPGPQTISLVTVECTTPVALTAGVEFNSIREREFAIQSVAQVAGITTPVNLFVSTAHSALRPTPIGMVNLRWYECNDALSLHSSLGVVAAIKGQSSGGSDVEYLVAPVTFGLFRTAFLSPGLHVGRDVRLGAGFREGEVVPPNITTAPIQKLWKVGFGFAVTFTKP
jgi:hypothetical protein